MSDLPTDVESAIKTVARRLARSHLQMLPWLEEWGNYPEIGEHDWQAVEKTAMEMIERPSDEAFNVAYLLLKARAVDADV